MRHGRTAVFAVVVFALGISTASAYTVIKNGQGNTKAWSQTEVDWRISNSLNIGFDTSSLQPSFEAAFDAWQDLDCTTITFNYEGLTNGNPHAGIYIRSNSGSGWNPSTSDTLAYTTSKSSSNGAINESSIVFNGTQSWALTTPTPVGHSDIQAVLTHEIGHAIGLDHSRHLEATMWFQGGGAEARYLEEDDARGACFLYPAVPFEDGQACDACDATSNCADGYCWNWGSGHAYCGVNCTSSSQCDEGYSCVVVDADVESQCMPDNDYCNQYGGNVGLGQFCYGNEVCQSGMCLTSSDSAYCTQGCTTSCPAGFSCVGDYCVIAGDTPYGGACEESADCATGYCSALLTKSLCTMPCGLNGGSCPDGDQCLQDVICVPPGAGGVGAPCIGPEQCQGTYCVDGKCTQPCSQGCPEGTTCNSESGFCVGFESGSGCTSSAECPSGLTCLTTSAAGAGQCELECNPLKANTVCVAGEVCEWLWQGWLDNVTGRCIPAIGGALVYEPCTSTACELNLVCDLGIWDKPSCHNDCRINANNLGCASWEKCVSLDDPSEPERGICVPKDANAANPYLEDPAPEPEPEPRTDTGVGEDDAAPGPDPVPPGDDEPTPPDDPITDGPLPGWTGQSQDSGCGSAHTHTPFAWLAMIFGALCGWRRRVWGP